MFRRLKHTIVIGTQLAVATLAGCGHNDQVPLAKLPGDQTVEVASKVVLDGSASSDPDGDRLTYRWYMTPPAGSKAQLDNSNLVKPTFTPDVAGEYTVKLQVNDGHQFSELASEKITAVAHSAAPPLADAGADQTVDLNATVTLDGSKSSDVAGKTLTYKWTLTAPKDSKAALDHADAAKPTFVADVIGEYTASLVVNNGTLDSTATTVKITAAVKAPTAKFIVGTADSILLESGSKVLTGETVVLDGTASGKVNFTWTVTDKDGKAVQLAYDDPKNVAVAHFVANTLGDYTISLVVNNGIDSPAQSTKITAVDGATTKRPKAVATFKSAVSGNDDVRTNDQVNLDGGEKSAGVKFSKYSWGPLVDPDGQVRDATVTVDPNNPAKATFKADKPGNWLTHLVVEDDLLASKDYPISIVVNDLPAANAGGDRNVENGTVVLDGSASKGGTKAQLTYTWKVTGPDGKDVAVTPDKADPAKASFDSSTDGGAYQVSLTVNDGRDSAAATSTIKVAKKK
jgi:hypothetical protein